MASKVARLFYDYPSTSKMRFKKANVWTNEQGLLLVMTEKLKFTIAEKICIMTKDHVYIPMSVYKEELQKFWKRVYNKA